MLQLERQAFGHQYENAAKDSKSFEFHRYSLDLSNILPKSPLLKFLLLRTYNLPYLMNLFHGYNFLSIRFIADMLKLEFLYKIALKAIKKKIK